MRNLTIPHRLCHFQMCKYICSLGCQKLLEDIDMDCLSVVIVRDMSRLGRDYLQVGYYTDTYFPDRDIRFIAINDCVDSADGEVEYLPSAI